MDESKLMARRIPQAICGLRLSDYKTEHALRSRTVAEDSMCTATRSCARSHPGPKGSMLVRGTDGLEIEVEEQVAAAMIAAASSGCQL